MSDEQSEWAAESVVACLRESLGGQFQALYRLDEPAGEIPADLLIVVADAFWSTEAAGNAPFCRLRQALMPVWKEAGSRFQDGLLLATMPGLANFMRLYPLFARQLSRGRLVAAGEAWGDGIHRTVPMVEPPAEAAYWAGEVMRLSAVLAPGLMEPAAVTQRLQELQGAVTRRRRQPVAADESPVQLLAELQERLCASLPVLPCAPAAHQAPLEGAPPPLPHLRAIYERGQRVLLLLPALTFEALAAVDWPQVAAHFQGHFAELQVSTPAQFRLTMQRQEPLLHALRAYAHLWGEDVIGDLEVERWRVLHDAARLPALVLTADLPRAYLTGDDVYRVVHDCHNRLLNIQLQHELLARLLQLPQAKPPTRLPDPAAPQWQRIGAVADQLAWWGEYYLREMVSCAP
jgi:hypothetical protein